jgi:hypothetical protein
MRDGAGDEHHLPAPPVRTDPANVYLTIGAGKSAP